MNKILLTIPVLMILIPISANAETYTFILSGGDEIEKEFWFPSGSVEYSIHVSGGDERIIVEILDPKFNSFSESRRSKRVKAVTSHSTPKVGCEHEANE